MPQKQPSVPLVFRFPSHVKFSAYGGCPMVGRCFPYAITTGCLTARRLDASRWRASNLWGGAAPSCIRICRIRILAPVSLSAPFELVIQPICKRRAAGFLFNRASLASALECRPPDCRPDNLPARRPVYSLEWHRKRCGVT